MPETCFGLLSVIKDSGIRLAKASSASPVSIGKKRPSWGQRQEDLSLNPCGMEGGVVSRGGIGHSVPFQLDLCFVSELRLGQWRDKGCLEITAFKLWALVIVVRMRAVFHLPEP